MKDKWLQSYMKCAETFSELSHAKRLKVGAVIVKDNRIISIGYNGTPSGWENSCEDIDNNTKPEVIHAEMNCITKLARSNESGEGAAMFITHSPCLACAKVIYGSGVKHVYFKYHYRNFDGIEFLEKCGIECLHLSIGTDI